MNFTTEETVVGKYIGQTLYKKIYEPYAPSAIGTGRLLMDENFTGTFRFGFGFLSTQFSSLVSIPFAEGANTIKIEQNVNTNDLYLYFTTCDMYGFAKVIIFYTK